MFAVNDAAVDYPGALTAFCTLHPEKLAMWLAARRAAGRPDPADVIAHQRHPLVDEVLDYQWPGMTGSGSSGLFAVKAALLRGYRVVCCGVPMDGKRTHYSNSTFKSDVNAFRDAWLIAKPRMQNVRSMSGWTAELLGTPDDEFLYGVTP